MQRKNIKRILKSITPPIIVELLRPRATHPTKEAASAFEESKKSVQSDEYIRWICQIIGGFLDSNHGNIVAFDYAIRRMPQKGAIIEIGSFLGLSTNIIAYLTLKHGRDNRFFNCDPWLFEEAEKPIGGYFDASSPGFREYVMKVFAMSLELFSENRKPYTIEGTSEQFLRQWMSASSAKDVLGRETVLGGPISFAYIDGAHTYQAAKDDFLGIDHDLLPGGYVLFDDSSDDSPFECRKVVAEIIANPAYELVFKTPNYLFRKRS